jgi:MoaA/NifB/PqqE/SkfB family radical SAM enzyme
MYGYVKENHPLSQKDSMSAQQWYDVLSRAHKYGFRVLEVGGRGEPTLSPVFTNVVALAHDLGYRIELLSNALNDKAIVEILPYLKKLTINLNAVNEQSMSDIHQPSPGFSFDRSIGLVKNVLKSIQSLKLDIELRTNYVVTKQSLKTMFTFPQQVNHLFSKELGDRKIYISYQHVHNYIKTPQYLGFDFEGLQKVLMLAQLNNRNMSLLNNTNLAEFIKKTEKLIDQLKPFSEKSQGDWGHCSSTQYTCEVHKYLMFIDGNGDCFGCYNPFRMVNGLSVDKDPFYFGNLLKQNFEEVFSEKNGFYPRMDVTKQYWRPCLLCKAKEVAPAHLDAE